MILLRERVVEEEVTASGLRRLVAVRPLEELGQDWQALIQAVNTIRHATSTLHKKCTVYSTVCAVYSRMIEKKSE